MFVITGATGHLGPLVIQHLLARGVPANRLVAVVRDPSAATALSDKGVDVRRGDYDRPETLDAAFAGAEKVLLVSSNAVGQRVKQHAEAAAAARRSGVEQLIYTSLLRTDTSRLALAAEHLASENAIREAGVPFVFLRNSWYIENYTEHLAPILEHGVLIGSAGDGRVSAATRFDYAEAAAAVLMSDGHSGAIYELAGDDSFGYHELAAAIAEHSGTPVVYQAMSAQEHLDTLLATGAPRPMAEFLVDCDAGVARGDIDSDSPRLRELLGRPTTPLSQAVAAAMR